MFNAHMAPSFVFSVLIVAVAAVVLYRPEPPLLETRADDPPAFKAADAPPPTSGVPRTDSPGAVETREPSRTSAVMAPNSRDSPRQAIQAADVAATTTERSARSAFVRVEPGESLADVAVRVYGSKDAAVALWSANRDQLGGPDEPLPPGCVLRTP